MTSFVLISTPFLRVSIRRTHIFAYGHFNFVVCYITIFKKKSYKTLFSIYHNINEYENTSANMPGNKNRFTCEKLE